MRPQVSQSHLRFPFTYCLGNEGAVRVLRALLAHGGALSVSQLAREGGLTPRGTRQTLDNLVRQRIVKVLGQSRSQLFAIDAQNPLYEGLQKLFGCEQSLWDELFNALREILQANEHVEAAWYYGSVARGEDTPASDLDIAIIASEGQAEMATESIRQELQKVEDRLFVHCSVVGLSGSDAIRLSEQGDDWWRNLARDAKVLKGTEPGQYLRAHKPLRLPA